MMMTLVVATFLFHEHRDWFLLMVAFCVAYFSCVQLFAVMPSLDNHGGRG